MRILEFLLVSFLFFWVGFFTHRVWSKYYRSTGTIFVEHSNDRLLYSLELDGDPERLQYKKTVVFEVKNRE